MMPMSHVGGSTGGPSTTPKKKHLSGPPSRESAQRQRRMSLGPPTKAGSLRVISGKTLGSCTEPGRSGWLVIVMMASSNQMHEKHEKANIAKRDDDTNTKRSM